MLENLENIHAEDIAKELKENKKIKMIALIIGGVVVLVLGYFLYRQFVVEPKNEKSQDSYWVGLNYAMMDSTDLAIDELKGAVKKYDGYVGGEVAQFVLGKQLMLKGEYKKALEELEGVDTEDTYVAAMAKGLIGDCYSELEQYTEAASAYIEAAETNSNELTTPMYLFKAGLVAEKLKDLENAKKYYEQIRDEYQTYASKVTIDKYIARVSSASVK